MNNFSTNSRTGEPVSPIYLIHQIGGIMTLKTPNKRGIFMNSRKLIVSLFLLLLISAFITGCAAKSKQPTTGETVSSPGLVKLANLERQLLPELEEIKQYLDVNYKDWESGKFNREELNNKLKEDIKPRYSSLSKKFTEETKVNPLSEEDTKNVIYTDGLNNGKLLRKDVGSFITAVTVGQGTLVPEKEGKNYTVQFKPIDDKQLKELYQKNLVNSFNEHLNKLNKSLRMIPKE